MAIFQTEKKFKKPTDIQREFHGVEKIAKFERVKITESSKHAKVTTASMLEWHYKSGAVEETSELTEVTARIPKSLLKDVVEHLSFIEKNPDKKKRKPAK